MKGIFTFGPFYKDKHTSIARRICMQTLRGDVGSYTLGENLSASGLTVSMLRVLKQEGD